MVCWTGAGNCPNPSTSMSMVWTSLRRGPCPPSPSLIIMLSKLPLRFSRSPRRLSFLAAACWAAYPESETFLVQSAMPSAPSL